MAKINGLKLVATIAIALLVYIFWESKILYPITMFSTLLHEISHALIALSVGASVEALRITPSTEGYVLAQTFTPMAGVAVLSAGYLGSALFGMLFLIATKWKMIVKALLIALVLIIGYAGFVFGSGAFTQAMIILFVMGFFLLFLFGGYGLTALILRIVGIAILLYTPYEIFQAGFLLVESDVQMLGRVSPFPSEIWAIFFIIVSLAMALIGLYYSITGEERNEDIKFYYKKTYKR